MNEIFNFKGQEVRTVTIDNEPYFVGKDVAGILGYTNPQKALRDHIDEEDKTVNELFSVNGTKGVLINESGLYSLVLKSKLPQAKEFKRWVTSEVLPTIRKHGMFATDELLDNPDFAIATLQKLKEEREAKKLLEAQIEADKPKVLFADAVSATRLFEWLRNQGYLIKRKGRDWNMPTQKSAELGLIRIKETSITHSDGHITVNKTPLVTGKGQQYFINKFLDQVS